MTFIRCIFPLEIRGARQHHQSLHMVWLRPSDTQTWLAGKSPMNGGFNRHIIYLNGACSIAMLDCWRVYYVIHLVQRILSFCTRWQPTCCGKNQPPPATKRGKERILYLQIIVPVRPSFYRGGFPWPRLISRRHPQIQWFFVNHVYSFNANS